jgi:glutamyl-tRNA synthetase
MTSTVIIEQNAKNASSLSLLMACLLLEQPFELASSPNDKVALERTLMSLPGREQQDRKRWIDFAIKSLSAKAFSDLQAAYLQLSEHLKFRSYVSGDCLGVSDCVVFAALKLSPVFLKVVKEDDKLTDVRRWFNHLSLHPLACKAQDLLKGSGREGGNGQRKDQASFDIDLPDAEMGKVVTRFPPEPSGYLHIGHAKAVLLNQYFAQHYQGRLIVRFDDTNPDKETSEYERVILEDLELLGVKGNMLTRTSDHFGTLERLARQLIEQGDAYCDDTPQEQMRQERFDGIASKCREHGVAENMRRFGEMEAGSEEGQRNCLRAKIDMQHVNKALRDPVLYRVNLTPHHATGTKFRIYPTYDFACPVVDSVEGVTHALRTSEYNDRNEQYRWILARLQLRTPHIWDYSRLNFVYTLLSKRKLNWFVKTGRVGGWDDPRFPTVRGILRRGLTLPALREYILMQGPSKNTILLEWDKLWNVNKRLIDPVAPRHTALVKANLCPLHISGLFPDEPFVKDMPRHKKNADLGLKTTSYGPVVWLEQLDAEAVGEGEEVTLMDWGNVIIRRKHYADSIVTRIDADLHLAGDFKLTDRKLTWLGAEPQPLTNLLLVDYDYLITKRKLEEEDTFEDCLTPRTEFLTPALGDANLRHVRPRDIVQLERKGFYIVDDVTADGVVKLILIPDGKAKSLACKSPVAA